MSAPRWAYAVCTVPDRIDTLLPRTLESLKAAGFERPRLMVDGAEAKDSRWAKFGLEVTARSPRIHLYANWMLGLAELLARNPSADRFAMFQDDCVAYRNLRRYLDRCRYPEKGYWNLITFRDNDVTVVGKPMGCWIEGAWLPDRSSQCGRGAVALVFNREAVLTLLHQPHVVDRAIDGTNARRNLDGAIVCGMNKAGWREFVHNPSLVQHTGVHSTLARPIRWPENLAGTFLGESYDAMDLPGGPAGVNGKEGAAEVPVGNATEGAG